MSTEQGGFAHLLGSLILPKVQLIALGISLLGVVFLLMGNSGAETILIAGLSTLAATYFLVSFIPPQIHPGTKPSLHSYTVSKVIYIALSVTLIGILFAVLALEGADKMLLIGCSVLTIGALVSAILIVTNHDNLPVLRKPLLHGIGILLLGVYFLTKLSIITF